jgi:DNA-binding NtrC family response regulator
MVCRAVLELERFRVREADGIDAARVQIARERPGLVFLDVHLAGDESDALLDELVDDGVPVVVVTGSAELEPYIGRAREVIRKPFDPSTLTAAARRHTAER